MYLALYNGTVLAAWSVTALLAIQHIAIHSDDPLTGYFQAIEKPLKVAQTLAILEVVHVVFGLVRSSLFSTFLQILSRISLLWLITVPVQDVHDSFAFALMSLSWCLVEIPRYSFYLSNLLFSKCPGWLTWIRYSLFVVLYPSGISGELLCIWTALPYIKESGMWNYPMPNHLNFGFDYYIAVVVSTLLYLPGSPFLYTHMLKQRRKNLEKLQNDKVKIQ